MTSETLTSETTTNETLSAQAKPGEDAPLALFVGMPGPVLSPDAVAFLRETNPYGLFLFRRNIETPDQVRALVAQFREAVGRPQAPVFIDQEGGRVQRLDNGNWPSFRALGDFGALARKDRDAAIAALRASTRAMGTAMCEIGVGSGTTPVLDLALAGKHRVIGDRAFSDDPELNVALGRVVVEAMLEVGAMPIIKHIPGYGRAEVDPHFDLPVITADRDTLRESDFAPFLALKDAPWAMVAHIVFSAFDPDRPVSVSPIMHDVIRNDLGYDGVIITDCLTMEALGGTWQERVTATLDAGYDIALLSQGMADASAPEEMLARNQSAAAAARPLSQASLARIARGEARLSRARYDIAALHAECEEIFERLANA